MAARQDSLYMSQHTLRRTKLFRLACTADTARESSERNNLLVFLHVTEVGVGLGQLEAYIAVNLPSPVTRVVQAHLSKLPQPHACS